MSDKTQLRNRIGSMDVAGGDNLAIVLASYFDRHMDRPDDDETDTELGWGVWVLKQANKVLDELADFASVQQAIPTVKALTERVQAADRRIAEQDAELATLRKRVAELEAERGRLRAIVDKLPKTADGAPVVPDMAIYPRHPVDMEDGDGEDCAVARMYYYDDLSGEMLDEHQCDVTQCYSSPEARAAALAQPDANTCTTCKGRTTIIDPLDGDEQLYTCPDCGGSGRAADQANKHNAKGGE